MLQRLLARLSIRAKLWLGFGLLLVVLTVVAAKTLLSLEETNERMGNVVHRIQPAVLDAMALSGELERAAASLGFYLLSKEESQRAAYEASLNEIDALLAELRGHDLVQRTPELQKPVASVVQKAERFKQYRERMLELATDNGKNFPAISFAAQNINPLSQEALQLMSQMILSETMEEATQERKELLAELNEMRYAWSNVMNGVRAYLAFRNESALQEVGLYQDSVGTILARLQEKQDLLTFEQVDSLEQFVGVRQRFMENYAKMQSIHGGPQWRTDAYLVRSEMGPLLEATKADLDALVDRLRGDIESNSSALVEQVNETSTVVSVLLAIGLVLGMMGAWIVSNLIAQPIRRAVDTMNDIAEGGGDLTCNMSTDTRDELGAMCTAFNRFVGKIRDIVGPVKSSTEQLSDAAEDLTRIAGAAADGVRRQRAETEQVAAAMNEMTATAQEMASNAKLAADSAQQADKEAGDGRRVVAQTVDTIQRLADAVERATGVIRRLEADSENIGGVLDVIRGIAEQTNLLALNAAIEAARAGEQGRGFAVVADEVRTLASRSHQSTEEIRSMIEQLQSGARDAVAVMDEGQQHVQSSVDQAAQAGTALEAITRAVATISEMNAHIAHAAEQQGDVAEEINRNISNISRVAEQSASETEQLGSASSQLARLSDELKGLVGHFRT